MYDANSAKEIQWFKFDVEFELLFYPKM